MRICLFAVLSFGAIFCAAQKGGFSNAKGVYNTTKNTSDKYSKFTDYNSGVMSVYDKNKDIKYLNLHSKKILIFGGLHGSLTATAEVLSFAINYCDKIRKTDTYNTLFRSFTIEFWPIVNEPAYTKSYANKNDENKDISYKGYGCSDEGIDPDMNFPEEFEEDCSKYTGQNSRESPVTKKVLNNLDDVVVIINIQDIGSDILGGYTNGTELEDYQKYFYKKLTSSDYTTPSTKTGSLMNYGLANNIYVVQYEHEAKKSIGTNLKSEFKDEFETVFEGLKEALADISIVFDKALENDDPTEDDPSIITFYVNVTNNYFYDVVGNLRFNLTINYKDRYRELTCFAVDLTKIYLYDKIKINYPNLNGIACNKTDEENSIYRVNVTKIYLEPLCNSILKFKFNRTIGGEILFDADFDFEGIEFYFNPVKSYNRGYKVTKDPKNSDKTNKAPRNYVLFIMGILFVLIVLTILCTVLIKDNKNKLLR